MDLDFSEEQQVLREMFRGVLAEHSPIEVVRRTEDDPRGYPEALWKQLAEVGATGILIPEEHGGAGQSLVEAAILYEELGRALAPVPHFPSAVLAARLLMLAGSEAQQREWLPRIASGEAILTVAWLEPDGSFRPRGVQLRATPEGDGLRLDGVKRHVSFARAASALIVLARTGPEDADVDLFLVDPAAPGLAATQLLSLASDAQYELRFDGVRVAASQRLGAAKSGWATFERALEEGIVLLAAQAIGGADRALEITVDYAKERKQFDKPLGAFQAIAHYLADASTRIDGGRTLVYEAAWAHANGKDNAGQLAAMAKLFACQTYRDVTAMCQQVWGGVGFTIEYDIQLFFRRAKQLQLSWWDTRELEERVAASLLD
jgi:alkylation response protein AidB-like acyl-CoA dehydrogenase